ncbi:MAG: hypothetical protein U9N07_05835 [Euryarchaeota archaeon]|nr:hypothetical protein [Euryarchaeota archaeon]
MINCEDLSGIGGSVETYVIEGALILFGEYAMEMPVFVIKHPLETMSGDEKVRILRFPSILGRDIINKFRLIFDKEKDEILMGDKTASGYPAV